jgi:2-polyprenyl-3-methyl-5-hydroxy-6-metoxy-1,4-benzoquinol methylase
MGDTIYVLGHSQAEIRRLIKQASIVQATTERLLRSAGIERGMRVLDLGCGAGDVSMLAATLVGVSGSVVGIDRDAQVLAIARKRAQTSGFLHVAFAEASVDTFAAPVPFDLVIVRYVLVHQVDPVAFLQTAARFAGPRGVLALHEPILDRPFMRSLPYVPLWQQAVDRVLTMFQAGAPSWDAAGRLIEHFFGAGLPQPTLFCETPVGGGVDASTTPGSRTRLGPSCRRWCRAESRPPRRSRSKHSKVGSGLRWSTRAAKSRGRLKCAPGPASNLFVTPTKRPDQMRTLFDLAPQSVFATAR